MNIIPLDREPVAAPSDDQREDVYIVRWNGQFGWARRKKGGDLFFHLNDVISEGIETIKPGTKLYLGVGIRNGKWFGHSVEVYQEAQ